MVIKNNFIIIDTHSYRGSCHDISIIANEMSIQNSTMNSYDYILNYDGVPTSIGIRKENITERDYWL